MTQLPSEPRIVDLKLRINLKINFDHSKMSTPNHFPQSGVFRTGSRGQVRKPQQRHRPSSLHLGSTSASPRTPDFQYPEHYAPTPHSAHSGSGSRGPIRTPYPEQYALMPSPSSSYYPEQYALTPSPRSATRPAYPEQYALTPPFSPAVRSPEPPYNYNHPTSHPRQLISHGDSRRYGLLFTAQYAHHIENCQSPHYEPSYRYSQPSQYGQAYAYPQRRQYPLNPQHTSRISSQYPVHADPVTPGPAPPTPEPPESGSPYTPTAPHERRVHFSEQGRRAHASMSRGRGGGAFVVPRPLTPRSPRTLRAAGALLDLSTGGSGASHEK